MKKKSPKSLEGVRKETSGEIHRKISEEIPMKKTGNIFGSIPSEEIHEALT